MFTVLSLSTPSPLTSLPSPQLKPKPLKQSFFNGLNQTLPPLRLTTRSSASAGSAVVVTAKRDEELQEIRAKTTEELHEEIVDLKGDIFMLRLRRSNRLEINPSDFRRMRKRVARMLTVKRERELEEGITKRMSRKLDRQWKKSIVARPPPLLIKMREEEAAEKAKESEQA